MSDNSVDFKKSLSRFLFLSCAAVIFSPTISVFAEGITPEPRTIEPVPPPQMVATLVLDASNSKGDTSSPIPDSASITEQSLAKSTIGADSVSPEKVTGNAIEDLPSLAEILQTTQPSAEIPRRFQGLFENESNEQPAIDLEGTADKTVYNVPIVVNPGVEGHMRFFHTSIRERFEQWLVRLGRYKHHVERIFAQFNLPSDLIFLSLVESGFNPHAYSRARATGPWQFMSGTAKNYGLRIDQYVDERRDPIKSTIAAAQYLRDLYDMFGTWPLAMAAYNAGEGKVMRALQKTQSTSYWEIARTKHLKKETKDYVPRFMAATIIAKNPDRYGFSEIAPDPHEFEEATVDRSMHLRDISAATGISFETLDHLNPELRRAVTPPGESYHLKVPVGSKALVESSLDKVKTWKGPLPAAKGEKRSSQWYHVRVGDTVQTIAKRFRLSVPELKARNHLSSRSSLTPGMRLKISP